MSKEILLARFETTQQRWREEGELPLAVRREYLQRLRLLLRQHSDALSAAIHVDFHHRSSHESYFLELFPTIKAIEYCLKHMGRWAKPKRKKVSYLFYPAKAYVYPQALGVVGNMSPWNYPIYLALVPAVYAIAAGNRVLVKMSELTPNTGRLLQELIEKYFPEGDLSIINGGVDLAKQFSQLPFNHLIFTGSTAVGRHIMQAASDKLTPITLELGGKSPALISNDCPDVYLDRLLMGKCLNAGQTCIAPDYLLLPVNKRNTFEATVKQFIEKHYPAMPNTDDYTSIISVDHFQRLLNLIEDALEKGAEIVQFGEVNEQERKIPLTLIFKPADDMKVMKEEIFGPVLPVITYDSFDQALTVIDKHRDPLAMYYFGHDQAEITCLQKAYRSGALTINDTVMHIAIDDLPFGGVGDSGIGCYHGKEGFERFSLMKPVFIQKRFSGVTWLYPPYGKLLKLFLRWIGKLTIKE